MKTEKMITIMQTSGNFASIGRKDMVNAKIGDRIEIVTGWDRKSNLYKPTYGEIIGFMSKGQMESYSDAFVKLEGSESIKRIQSWMKAESLGGK